MEPIKCDIEDAGLDALLVGMKHPAYRDNKLFKALYIALSLEWTCRQMNETSEKALGLPFVGTLTDLELKESAGFLDGMCETIDLEAYPKTFSFCFALLRVLLEEIQLRSTDGETVH